MTYLIFLCILGSMPSRRTNPNFLNGVPELLILKLLAGREMYGYELVRAIRRNSAEIFSFGEGCIYPILHSLEKDRALSSFRKEVNGRTRLYYKLTPSGKKKLELLSGEWKNAARGVNSILEGGAIGLSQVK